MKDKLLGIIVNEFPDIAEPDNYVEKVLNNAELLIYYKNMNIIGFIAFYANDDKNKSAFVTLVYTDSSNRGNGIAYGLMGSMIESLKKKRYKYCKLEVKKDNYAAIALYEKLGFSILEGTDHAYFMGIQL